MENKGPQNNNPQQKPSGKGFKFNLTWIYIIIIAILIGSYLFSDNAPVKEVPFSTFENYMYTHKMEKIDVYSSRNVAEALIVKIR